MESTEDEKRTIIWRKWNPMIRPNNDPEFIPEGDVSSFDIGKDDEDEEEGGPNEGRSVIMTPLGIFPIQPWQDSSKVFNYWMGETDFDIDGDVVRVLDTLKGIEGADIYSRYKFRISVGNCFKFQEVKHRLEQSLGITSLQSGLKQIDVTWRLEEDLLSQLKQLQIQVGAQYPFWAICVFPNKKFNLVYTTEDSEEFQHKLQVYEGIKQMTRALILRYDVPSQI